MAGLVAMDKSVHPPVCWIGVGTLLCRSVDGGASCDGQECPSSCLLDGSRYTLVPQCQWWGQLRWTRVSILLFDRINRSRWTGVSILLLLNDACAAVSTVGEGAMDRSVHPPVSPTSSTSTKKPELFPNSGFEIYATCLNFFLSGRPVRYSLPWLAQWSRVTPQTKACRY